jgi:hypothetical protein
MPQPQANHPLLANLSASIILYNTPIPLLQGGYESVMRSGLAIDLFLIDNSRGPLLDAPNLPIQKDWPPRSSIVLWMFAATFGSGPSCFGNRSWHPCSPIISSQMQERVTEMGSAGGHMGHERGFMRPEPMNAST